MSLSLQPNIIDAGDVLIVGGGLAGLFTALKLSHRHVTIMATGAPQKASASAWAQGGIAAALGPDDSPDLHLQDTIKAGAGLVDSHIAKIMTEEAKARINDLIAFGVSFDRTKDGRLRLGREAAHSRNRIISVRGDRTGKAIMSALGKRVSASPSIRTLVGFSACELAIEDGRVAGVFAYPTHRQGISPPLLVKARATILACGGCGHLYATTTNPIFANGEALAMAARAGAEIMDAEFMQFHPTAFATQTDPAFLATEALRGEGAVLLNAENHRFMPDYHVDAELAPRDIVARAVAAEIDKTGRVGLDLRANLAERLHTRFPTVFDYCRKTSIDPTKELLPITPAAHYHMGGIKVDENGHTSLKGLWACGESAASGVHGANRLASNSLLEAIIFGARIAAHIDDIVPIHNFAQPQPPVRDHYTDPIMVQPAIKELRATMTRYVGVVRKRAGLLKALQIITRLERAATGIAPLANMCLAAFMISAAALKREESRGSHFRSDYPNPTQNPTHNCWTLTQMREFVALQENEQDNNQDIKHIRHAK
ncbi:MAG: L-aspartate oxidase [Alphaproteobacteria bacterium]|nr:L-aspartate oxidase [Alphaproteobacteria bacterium]